MIPKIQQAPGLSPEVLSYIDTLKNQGFTGDIATDYGSRLTMAVDNSLYQSMPQAIVFPRSVADISLLSRVAADPAYEVLSFTPRGGGQVLTVNPLTRGDCRPLSVYESDLRN